MTLPEFKRLQKALADALCQAIHEKIQTSPNPKVGGPEQYRPMAENFVTEALALSKKLSTVPA